MACCGNGNNGDDGDLEAKAMITGLPLRHTVRNPGASTACAPGLTVAPCVTGCSVPLCSACNYTPCRCSNPQFSPRVARSSCEPCAIPVQPYYQQIKVCAEDNRQIIRTQILTGVFKNKDAFAMPACGASIRVVFDAVGDIPVGAWLWSMGLGYLTIQGFTSSTGEIQLLNECPSTNCTNQAAPGTPIPKCSLFVVLAPNCGGASQGPGTLYPYLNSGFTAPEDGDCIDIAVTNTNGLYVNAVITINTGEYTVTEIKSSTLITICNTGQGLTPGTVVNYQDAADTLIVPIVLLQSNACLATAVPSGVPLGCHNSITVPIAGTLQDQIFVWNEDLGEAEWRSLGIPTLNCTELTVALTLDPALPSGTPYLVNVVSTSAYVVTDLVVVGATQFTVDSIVNGTQMYIVPVVDPVVITTYNAGSTLCSAGCCEVLENQITIINNYLEDNIDPVCEGDWLGNYTTEQVGTSISPTVINTASPLASGNLLTWEFDNPSCGKTMEGVIDFCYTWTFEQDALADVDTGILVARGYGAVSSTVVAPALLADIPNTYVYTTDGGANLRTISTVVPVRFTAAAGAHVAITAQANIQWTGGTAGNSFTTGIQLARIVVHGVCVT